MVRIDLETIQVTHQMIKQENLRNDFKQNPIKHCGCCDQEGHTRKYCNEMQANVKKQKGLRR